MADRKLKVDITADNSKLKKGLKESESAVDKFGGTIKKVGGLVAGAFAVDRIVDFGKEAIKLAGELEGVSAAFERIGSPKLLQDLRDATQNTVSDLELMKAAVQANNFQIPLNQMAALLRFAGKRAQETGQDVDYLVNSIVLGIGRKSPLILDNLGISAVRLRQELKGAGVEMNTVGDVAAAVGKIAAEEMKKAGDVIETNKVQLQQYAAEWENLKATIGNGLQSGFLTVVGGGIESMRNLTSEHVTLGNKILGFFNPAVNAANEAVRKYGEEVDKAAEKESTVARVIRETDERLRLKAQAEEAARAASELARKELAERTKAINEFLIAEGKANQALIESTDLFYQGQTKLTAWGEITKSGADATDILNSKMQQMNATMLKGANEDLATYEQGLLDAEYAAEQLQQSIARAAIAIGSDFAEGLGTAIAAGEGFDQVFKDLTTQIASALADILIMYGLGLGIPAGLPFIAAGLLTKGFSASVSAGGKDDFDTSFSTSSVRDSSNGSRLYGNDIKTANDYATGLQNRIG